MYASWNVCHADQFSDGEVIFLLEDYVRLIKSWPVVSIAYSTTKTPTSSEYRSLWHTFCAIYILFCQQFSLVFIFQLLNIARPHDYTVWRHHWNERCLLTCSHVITKHLAVSNDIASIPSTIWLFTGACAVIFLFR